MYLHTSRSALCLPALLMLTACGTMKVEGDLRLEGPLILSEGSFISDAMFERLEVGQESAWAIALFGEPDHRTALSDGSWVWRWTYTQAGTAPSLLNLDDETDEPSGPVTIQTTCVRIEEGFVIEKWRG